MMAAGELHSILALAQRDLTKLLRDRARLITTEVYVAAPRFIEVRIEARLLAAPRASFEIDLHRIARRGRRC